MNKTEYCQIYGNNLFFFERNIRQVVILTFPVRNIPSKFGGKDLEQKFENNFKHVITDHKVISIKRTISFL